MTATDGEINDLYAFVSVNPDDGKETVLVYQVKGEAPSPAMGDAADVDRIEQLRPLARRLGRVMGREVRLLRFTRLTEEPA